MFDNQVRPKQEILAEIGNRTEAQGSASLALPERPTLEKPEISNRASAPSGDKSLSTGEKFSAPKEWSAPQDGWRKVLDADTSKKPQFRTLRRAALETVRVEANKKMDNWIESLESPLFRDVMRVAKGVVNLAFAYQDALLTTGGVIHSAAYKIATSPMVDRLLGVKPHAPKPSGPSILTMVNLALEEAALSQQKSEYTIPAQSISAETSNYQASEFSIIARPDPQDKKAAFLTVSQKGNVQNFRRSAAGELTSVSSLS